MRQPGLKRSVAVEMLTEELVNAKFGRLDVELTSKQLAIKLLSTLEKLGMKPPMRDADLKSSYGYARVQDWEKE